MKGEFWDRLVSLLFPKTCVLCGRVTAYDDLICERCEPLEPENPCGFCGHREGSCVCRDGEPWSFARAVQPLVYGDNVRLALIRFKATPDERACRYFARRMSDAARLRFEGMGFDFITEVPMHPDRLTERGYNQAELLAEGVALELELPFRRGIISKLGDNISQHELDRRERFLRAQSAYVSRGAEAESARILLVDDIFTTGATAEACAACLMAGGARSVHVLCAAGTVKK